VVYILAALSRHRGLEAFVFVIIAILGDAGGVSAGAYTAVGAGPAQNGAAGDIFIDHIDVWSIEGWPVSQRRLTLPKTYL